MPAIRLKLLGAPELLHPGRDEPLLPERLTQLAVVLAARREWTTRGQLIALLWPELDDESARRNFRKLLFRARRQRWFDALETRNPSTGTSPLTLFATSSDVEPAAGVTAQLSSRPC